MQGVNKNKNKKFSYDMMMRQLPRMQDYFTLRKNMHVLFSGYGYCIVLHIFFFNIMLTKGFNILLYFVMDMDFESLFTWHHSVK